MTTKQKILIVDDDENIAELLSLYLTKECFDTQMVYDGEEALRAFDSYQPNLILLDLMLPKMNGFDVCRSVREHGRATPIIMLTAKSTEYDKVLGLDEGADDYVAKPFGMMELMARIRAALRHGGQEAPKEKTYSLGSLFVDPARHIVRDGDREVTLTLKEFQVLCLLLERAGTVFTRDQLLNTIWGYEFDGASRTVDVHIRTLRQKLGHSGDCIETVRGIGYKISTDLSAGTARNE